MTKKTPPASKKPRGTAPVRLLVVDDHPTFRRGIMAALSTENGFVICGEASSAEEALRLMRETDPDAAIIDIALGGSNGIELVKQIKAERPQVKIVVLSMHDESLFALRSMRAGAGAYVMKRESTAHVVAALHEVLKGGVYLSAHFRDQLVFKTVKSIADSAASPVDRLSDRELEVLQHIGIGDSTRNIAEALGLSVKTVETYRAHIKEKLGFQDNGHMVRFAIDWVGQQTV